MKTVSVYQCEFTGREFPTAGEAVECEDAAKLAAKEAAKRWATTEPLTLGQFIALIGVCHYQSKNCTDLGGFRVTEVGYDGKSVVLTVLAGADGMSNRLLYDILYNRLGGCAGAPVSAPVVVSMPGAPFPTAHVVGVLDRRAQGVNVLVTAFAG
jgi:hypothetical protein